MSLTDEERRLGECIETADWRAIYQREAPTSVCPRVRQAADQARARIVLGEDTRGVAGHGNDLREAMA